MTNKCNWIKGALLLLVTVSFTSVQSQVVEVDSVAGKGDMKSKLASALAGKTKEKIKPYSAVITGAAKTQKGLFLVHEVDNRYYFELSDSLFNKDFLIMTRVSRSGVDLRSSGSMAGYAGDEVNSLVVSFEKGANDKVFLLKKSFSEYSADSTKAMFMAVAKSNMQPIAHSFDVKAHSSDGAGAVIDVTDLITTDNGIFHFDANNKKNWKIGSAQADKSYVVGVQSFPMNTNIKTVKTYAKSGGASSGGSPLAALAGGGGATVTLELTTSIIALPSQPMRQRHFDPRVGYFVVTQTDFDSNPQGVKKQAITKRWRLEPKDGDIERYKRGELVEPKKPIVIYIDPATPAKWVPYLVQGVNDWQAAFEKAGFKNAIIGRVAPTPEEDPTWSMDDARNSVIVYKASSVPNASGPSTADPRSGEILETHINWYHNVMEVLRNWYLVQAGAIDPRARKMELDDNLMGELIRFVSSHEVGHTLGLRHNFGSSSTVPVEKLRDRNWLEKNGHTPSIMDYARFNYVAQPEDNVGERGIFPRIGDYDEWAIEWGYRWTDRPLVAETQMLAELTTEKQKNNRLWFGTEMNPNDPRSQSEDLGDNAMLASDYGVMNLKRVLAGLPEWSRKPNEGYGNLASLYTQVFSQFGRYIGHVSKNIAGVYETPKMIEQEGPQYMDVEKEKQQHAVDWLGKNVLETPNWLIDRKITSLIGLDEVAMVDRLHNQVLDKLFDGSTYRKLIAAQAKHGDDAFTVSDLTNSMKSLVWKELKKGEEIDVFRRNLQKEFVLRLGQVLKPQAYAGPTDNNPMAALAKALSGAATLDDKNDASSILRAMTFELRNDIKRSIPKYKKNSISRHHLTDVLTRIDFILES